MKAIIKGIGIDTEENSRIAALIKKNGEHFLHKVFTKKEIEYCINKNDNFASFTARFAAKEALFKAIGSGLRDGLRWKDVETLNDNLGKPFVNLSGKAAEMVTNNFIHISITHTRKYASAFIIIERRIDD